MKKDLKKLRIGVLMGGLSSEREVSLHSGESIVKELQAHGHTVIPIDINSRSLEQLIKAKPDVVINALHGTYAEDGIMQGILEFLNIPHQGSGVLASAMCMNKIMAKEIMRNHGITTPGWHAAGNIREFKALKLKYPVVLKPEAEGSSAGVYIVKSRAEALKRFSTVKRLCVNVLVEDFIKGVEISVPVMGERVLPIIEISPKNEFYDYEAKYTAGMSDHIIPAGISKAETKLAEATALKVHKLLGCRDYSRIDMIIKNGKAYVLEVNTLPGMTSLSLFPESAKKAGISFYELLVYLLENALKRG
ncbi:MAG: D-alanine--D-alanine ligase [Spirochaetia bacterium]|nr:D-alanine--D-alanine ligase [Spirochaetia bacterium]